MEAYADITYRIKSRPVGSCVIVLDRRLPTKVQRRVLKDRGNAALFYKSVLCSQDDPGIEAALEEMRRLQCTSDGVQKR